MKILVTGGTGFVGWHIVRAAVTAGHEVVSLSRGVQRGSHVYPVRNVHIDLVRPDGHIGYRSGGTDLRGLEHYLARWLPGGRANLRG